MEKFYTYLWLREDGTPYYVGKGARDRAFCKSRHKVNPPKNKNNILLQFFPDEASAFAAEIFLISFYDRINNGGCLRNLTDGGEGAAGWRHTTESKLKISLANIGRGIGRKNALGHKHSAETRNKMSAAHMGNRNRAGQKHTVESRLKMMGNKNALGHKHTAATRLKMSVTHRKKNEARLVA